MLKIHSLPSYLYRAYQHAEYRVLLPDGEFSLKIGVFSPELQACHTHFKVDKSAFITAFNPASEMCTDHDNAVALASLTERADALKLPWLRGEGVDPEGHWPVEQSLLLLGAGRDVAVALGAEFGQVAIVFSGWDAVPKLLMTDVVIER